MRKGLLDWIQRNTISNEAWKHFDDLHITGNKQDWLKNATKEFKCIRNYIIKEKLPFFVELNIPFIYSKEKTGFNYNSISEIEKQLSSTPPSLYIFPNNYKNLDTIIKNSITLDENLFTDCNAYYKEVFDKSENEFYRSIFIIS